MADNVTLPGTGVAVSSDEIAGSVQVQYVKLMNGTSAATDVIPGEATNGLDVDVTRMSALVAGTALIGKVGIDQVTANANEVVVKSGTVTAVTAITNALPAGTNNIGDVDVLSIAAGDNNIGNVDIVTMPAVILGAGTAEIGKLAAGTAAIGKLAANSGVDIGDVDILSMPGTGVEDAAETAGGTLHMVGAVRRDTMASSSGTSGDNSTINTDANGALWVDPQGNVAHDAADAGNPIKQGAKAITNLAAATMVAAADRTDLYADLDGVQITKLYAPFGNLLSERTTNTDGAATALTTFGATADARNYITSVTICNSSATYCTVDLRDGAAGSVIWTFPVPATGGVTHNFNPPLKQPTANTALAFDASGAITTLTLSFNGFKSKA